MSLTRLIFSQNEWLEVHLPKGYDPNWSEEDTYYYALIWSLAFRKGFSEKRSRELAEAAVSKRVYPGIVFISQTEKDLHSLED